MELIASSHKLSSNDKNKILDILRTTKEHLDTYINQRQDIEPAIKNLFAKIVLDNFRVELYRNFTRNPQDFLDYGKITNYSYRWYGLNYKWEYIRPTSEEFERYNQIKDILVFKKTLKTVIKKNKK
jgi:hypothetical protein